jgi:predicted transposase YdaD
LKALVRRVPTAFLRLAGIDVEPGAIRTDDVTINLPEFRADQVLLVGQQDDPARWALHVEFQLRPDQRVLRSWFLKNAALTAQLRVTVPLLAIYLSRGRYRTFPSRYEVNVGSLRTVFDFDVLLLWEHADRIRNGELPELAPLLVLCEDSPTEETLREERALILGLQAPRAVKAELLAVSVTVGARYFAREVVLRHFQEELQILKEARFIEEWIEEAVEKGRAVESREMLLKLMRAKFANLPETVVARVNGESPEWCEEIAVRLLRAASLNELGF